MKKTNRLFFICVAIFAMLFSGCYTFKDISIPPEVKTVRVNYLENRARYINPQLSPQLSEALRLKINNQTRLTLITSDEAHYDISGYITDYSISTSGISNQQAASNRLNVGVHIVLKNRLDDKKSFEADVSRQFDFSANKSLTEAEAQLMPDILKNLSDEIFNRIFSDW